MFKKWYLLIFILGSTICFSQDILHYGVKFGAVASKPIWSFNSVADKNIQTKWGLDLGAFIEISFNDMISIVPEMHFVQKGMRYDIPITTNEFPDGNGEYFVSKPSANYLSIPISAKYSILKSLVELYVSCGVRIDVLISNKGDGFDFFYKQFKSTELGLNFTVGTSTEKIFGIGSGVELRYSPNVTPSYTDNSFKIRNSSIDVLFCLFL
ncbi:MAG: PorT family protein [Ignavibacteriales bacterium]|nr:PorT family protein [Ignavibacteriales bacterium]